MCLTDLGDGHLAQAASRSASTSASASMASTINAFRFGLSEYEQVISVHETVGPAEWPTPPLCRQYLVVQFGSLLEPARVEAAAVGAPLMWAVGTTADGQQELLGAWSRASGDGSTWPDVLGELWARGVEKIRWAGASIQGTPLPGAEAERPRVKHWCAASAQLSLVVASSLRSQRVILSAGDVSQRLQAAMTRSARRRGGRFADAESAFACLDRQWQHLECRLGAGSGGWARRDARPAPRELARAGAASGSPAR